MTKDKGIVLVNNEDKILRFINTSDEGICVATNNETKRLHLMSEGQYKAIGKNYTKVKSAKVSSIQKRKIKINDDLSLKKYEPNSIIKSEIIPSKEDDDKLPLYLRYSAIGHVSTILFVILISWTITKFIKPNEPTVVQVFKQNPKAPQQIVNASTKKIKPKKIRKARVSNKTRVAKTTNRSRKKSNRNQRKASQNVNNMGALGVLGGLNQKMNGSGGLNVKAAKNNAGSGYGGQAARGGHSRSLVGKGLVAAGTGSSGSVKGYGGYGTSGKGGGKPGYGKRNLGGSSSGALYALSDEALVEGGLDMDQINAVVIRNRGQLSQCYERALQQNSRVSGSVNIKFTIAGSGSVSSARVGRSSLNAGSIENCLIGKLRRWKFPKPVGAVTVRVDYPFEFKRKG